MTVQKGTQKSMLGTGPGDAPRDSNVPLGFVLRGLDRDLPSTCPPEALVVQIGCRE